MINRRSPRHLPRRPAAPRGSTRPPSSTTVFGEAASSTKPHVSPRGPTRRTRSVWAPPTLDRDLATRQRTGPQPPFVNRQHTSGRHRAGAGVVQGHVAARRRAGRSRAALDLDVVSPRHAHEPALHAQVLAVRARSVVRPISSASSLVGLVATRYRPGRRPSSSRYPAPPMPADLVLAGADMCAVMPPAAGPARSPYGATGSWRWARRTRSWSSTGPRRRRHLPGRMVVPGFQDPHVHRRSAARNLLNVNLDDLDTRDDYLEANRGGRRRKPGARLDHGRRLVQPRVRGRRARARRTRRGRAGPARVPDEHRRARRVGEHLRAGAAGITAPRPTLGRLLRARRRRIAHRLPAGGRRVHVRAGVAAGRAWPVEDLSAAAQRELHALGITGWQDAWVEPDLLRRTAPSTTRAG